MPVAEKLTDRIIGLAIEVHRHTGRALLESVYEQCLCHELRHAGIPFERQVGIPVRYKGIVLDQGFRADIIVSKQVIIEVKSVAAVAAAHESQLLAYLRMSCVHVGLLLNFTARRLVDGLKRFVVQESLRGPPWPSSFLRGKKATPRTTPNPPGQPPAHLQPP